MAWLLLPAGIFTADYLIKKRAESWKEEELPRKILGGKIVLVRLHNRGAAMNVMEHRPRLLTWCSAGMTAGIGACYVWLTRKKGMSVLKLGTGMLLGGAASNVWDRISRHYVVDYFRFARGWKRLQKLVFNISDLFIILGAALIAVWHQTQK